MNRQRKLALNKAMMFGVRKYYRWFRRYIKRVRIVEREIGGCVDAL